MANSKCPHCNFDYDHLNNPFNSDWDDYIEESQEEECQNCGKNIKIQVIVEREFSITF